MQQSPRHESNNNTQGRGLCSDPYGPRWCAPTPQAAAAGHVLGEVGEYMGEAAAPKPGEDAPKPGDMYAFSADPPESYAGESEAR